MLNQIYGMSQPNVSTFDKALMVAQHQAALARLATTGDLATRQSNIIRADAMLGHMQRMGRR